MHTLVFQRITGSLVIIASVCLSGCGSDNWGEKVSISSSKIASVKGEFAGGKPLSFPTDRSFNVFDTQRTSTGAGVAKASVNKMGVAMCRAEAAQEGTASAQFQVGQVIQYDGKESMKVTVVFNLDYEWKLRNDPADTTKPEDKLAMKLFIRDSKYQTLKKDIPVNLETVIGPESFDGKNSFTFDTIFEPGVDYQLIVSGMTEVTGTELSGALSELNIRTLQIELLPKEWPDTDRNANQ